MNIINFNTQHPHPSPQPITTDSDIKNNNSHNDNDIELLLRQKFGHVYDTFEYEETRERNNNRIKCTNIL